MLDNLLLVLYLLPLLKPWPDRQNVANLSLFNWMNWYHVLILVGDPLVILIGCVISGVGWLIFVKMLRSAGEFFSG